MFKLKRYPTTPVKTQDEVFKRIREVHKIHEENQRAIRNSEILFWLIFSAVVGFSIFCWTLITRLVIHG